MKNFRIISHRGNLNGPKSAVENSPESVDAALALGFECEVDFWVAAKDELFLGHDKPEFSIELSWLQGRSQKLWLHCKNLSALDFLISNNLDTNFFWHQNDFYTLTNRGYIWVYPGQEVSRHSILVLPERSSDISLPSVNALRKHCSGVCTDFPSRINVR